MYVPTYVTKVAKGFYFLVIHVITTEGINKRETQYIQFNPLFVAFIRAS